TARSTDSLMMFIRLREMVVEMRPLRRSPTMRRSLAKLTLMRSARDPPVIRSWRFRACERKQATTRSNSQGTTASGAAWYTCAAFIRQELDADRWDRRGAGWSARRRWRRRPRVICRRPPVVRPPASVAIVEDPQRVEQDHLGVQIQVADDVDGNDRDVVDRLEIVEREMERSLVPGHQVVDGPLDLLLDGAIDGFAVDDVHRHQDLPDRPPGMLRLLPPQRLL